MDPISKGLIMYLSMKLACLALVWYVETRPVEGDYADTHEEYPE